MPKFGNASKFHLGSCHLDIQEILDEAIKIMDFSVLCGKRSKELQDKLYEDGKSQLKYPLSYHNHSPSLAVDIVPYPVDWEDRERFCVLAGIIKAVAYAKGIEIEWGGDWVSFKDLPHFQLKK